MSNDIDQPNNENGLNLLITANNPLDITNNHAGPQSPVVESLDPLELQETYKKLNGARFMR